VKNTGATVLFGKALRCGISGVKTPLVWESVGGDWRRLISGASSGFLGLRRILQKQKASPDMSAIKAIKPTPRPTADAVLRRDVGSEPGPPRGAAPLALTHGPPEHALPAVQSLAIEHVPTNPGDVLVTLGVTSLSVVVALNSGLVV